MENSLPVPRTLLGALAPRLNPILRRAGSNYADHAPISTSLSDVAVMNTVTLGPEPSPTSPHRTHESLPSFVDHHVERGTNAVTRSARRSDWERLSGRRQLAPKDPLPTIPEDPLLTRRSVSARNSRMKACTFGSDIESLRPGSEEWMERIKSHLYPSGGDSTHVNPPLTS